MPPAAPVTIAVRCLSLIAFLLAQTRHASAAKQSPADEARLMKIASSLRSSQ
jgi:hypothetical protein